MRHIINPALACIVLTTWAVGWPSSVMALVYTVDRSFSNGTSIATLVGTLAIPEGNYVLMNRPPNPFTAVNLTLTVDGTPYAVNNVRTDLITGTGSFSIIASPTVLIFSASGDGRNPADLVFSDKLTYMGHNKYGIGSDAWPAFEIAYTDAGEVVSSVAPSFPVVFGVVPEPTTLTLLGMVFYSQAIRRRREKV